MEHWAPVEGFPGYEVSDLGSVRNRTTGRPLRTHISAARGVETATFRKEGRTYTRSVPRLVICAFVGHEPEIDANWVPGHINGDPLDNRADNLEWITRSQASQARYLKRRLDEYRDLPVLNITDDREYPNAKEAARDINGMEDYVIIAATQPYKSEYLGRRFQFLTPRA